MAWGQAIQTPLITDRLPHGTVTYVLMLLVCGNFLLSFPLLLHPAVTISESYIFGTWLTEDVDEEGFPKSNTTYWLQNLYRVSIVAATIGSTLLLGNSVDQFLGLAGAVTCAPLGLALPVIFHYRAYQILDQKKERALKRKGTHKVLPADMTNIQASPDRDDPDDCDSPISVSSNPSVKKDPLYSEEQKETQAH